ncbi:hypothetical protein AX16_009608 [Volvariella volvacea WC 439]|nr:hypothetical protein AX16_009608 [Volvariella volvacea WC 439]
MHRLTLIVAATKNNGIGANGQLPWRLPNEMKYFARVTSYTPDDGTNAVIMGRNTWDSIPTKFRPLPNRVNVVLSRNPDFSLGTLNTLVKKNLSEALQELNSTSTVRKVFVIGGATLYGETLGLSESQDATFADRVLLTRILSPTFDECDTFIPDFVNERSSDGPKWVRASHQELQDWAGFEVPNGIQQEKGVEYEFQMWTRALK